MAGFYEGYTKRKTENEQAGMRDLQQMGSLVQLQQTMKARQDEQQLKSMLSQSGGNLETVIQGALKAGRPDIAAKLAPLLEIQRKAQPQPRVVPPGSQLLGPNNEVLHTAPFKPDAPKAATTSDIGKLIAERDALPAGDPRVVVYNAAIKQKTEKAEKTFPIVQTADGIFERRPGGLVRLTDPNTGKPLNPTARERPLTEYQGKNAMYGVRASMAHKTLLDLEEKISVTGLAVKRGLQDTPVIGGALGAAANVALSKQQQQVEQAQRNFVNAVLRQESGAVINPSEFENAIKQYFPQPGDKKEVIEQKRQNRVAVINGFKKIAGHAWDDEASLAPSPAKQGGLTPQEQQELDALRKRFGK